MKGTAQIWILGLLAIFITGLVIYLNQDLLQNSFLSSEIKSPVKTQCTLDAKLCPNGSAVGRTGPNCEFAECPVSVEEVSQ